MTYKPEDISNSEVAPLDHEPTPTPISFFQRFNLNRKARLPLTAGVITATLLGTLAMTLRHTTMSAPNMNSAGLTNTHAVISANTTVEQPIPHTVASTPLVPVAKAKLPQTLTDKNFTTSTASGTINGLTTPTTIQDDSLDQIKDPFISSQEQTATVPAPGANLIPVQTAIPVRTVSVHLKQPVHHVDAGLAPRTVKLIPTTITPPAVSTAEIQPVPLPQQYQRPASAVASIVRVTPPVSAVPTDVPTIALRREVPVVSIPMPVPRLRSVAPVVRTPNAGPQAEPTITLRPQATPNIILNIPKPNALALWVQKNQVTYGGQATSNTTTTAMLQTPTGPIYVTVSDTVPDTDIKVKSADNHQLVLEKNGQTTSLSLPQPELP